MAEIAPLHKVHVNVTSGKHFAIYKNTVTAIKDKLYMNILNFFKILLNKKIKSSIKVHLLD
jgi:hypothetical protein